MAKDINQLFKENEAELTEVIYDPQFIKGLKDMGFFTDITTPNLLIVSNILS